MALRTIATAAAAAAAARKSRQNKEQVGAGGDKKSRPLHVSAKNVSTAQFLTTSYHVLLQFTTVYHIVLRPNTCNSLHPLTTSLVGLQGILPMLIKPTTPQHCRAELTHYPTGLLENKPPRRNYSCCLIKFWTYVHLPFIVSYNMLDEWLPGSPLIYCTRLISFRYMSWEIHLFQFQFQFQFLPSPTLLHPLPPSSALSQPSPPSPSSIYPLPPLSRLPSASSWLPEITAPK